MDKILCSLVILAIQFNFVMSQEKCECCTYNSLDIHEKFQEFFSPDSIRLYKINEAVIHTTEKFSDTVNNYLEAKFDFNKQGFVISRKWYNRGGKPHSIYTYDRNEKNQIIKISFSYLDSNEMISDFMPPEITDYYYDVKGRLIKIKERNYKGQIDEDSLSDFEVHEYDNSGRLSRVLRHYYWPGNVDSKHTNYDERISYDADQNLESLTYNDNKPWLKCRIKNDDFGKKILEEYFNVNSNSLSSVVQYEYDIHKRPISIKTQSGEGSFTECNDGGDFQETYSYNNIGLLFKIFHQFDNVSCTMNIEFN